MAIILALLVVSWVTLALVGIYFDFKPSPPKTRKERYH
jgi:hypothetical protein